MKEQADKILEILAKAESEIQRVIVDAAHAGDYRSVDMARNAAVNVRNFRMQLSNPTGKAESRARTSASRRKRKVASRRATGAAYPRFQVTNETLTRIGWSKKRRREYTHKTPRAVFDKTIKAMATLAQGGVGPFTAEQVIERINTTETETIPTYQVYGVIGMLRLTNCIKQIGREGYNIPPELVENAERKWSELSNTEK
ncbi:MAG: hypothetical protein ACYS74_04965 [Planctomycetota bacterium]|jgi:hypothetical protein